MIKNSLLKLFNIRHGEETLVWDLFVIEFFRGTAIAFFFTSAILNFIHNFSENALAKALPEVFILSSFFLWATGFIYTKFEHKYNIQKLGVWIPAVMAASIFLIWVWGNFDEANWFFYIMLCWFNVLYLLNNLQFWSIASIIYDVRQSKRLFSLISAGDIPAKLIGYSLALSVVHLKLIEPVNLLVPSFCCMLFSIPFINRLCKSDLLKVNIHGKHSHTTVTAKTKISALYKNFIGNKLIERIAVVSLLFSFCYVTITYLFYTKVKVEMNKDAAFEDFVIQALAVSKLMALIMMGIFTGRLLSRWGHRRSLAVMPVILLFIAIVLIMSNYAGLQQKSLLYITAILFLITEALRYSIHSPVFLALMQPLQTPERLRAHNIVKGIMDPFAYLLAGLILLALASSHESNIPSIYYLLLVAIIFWLASIFSIAKPYMQTLMTSISRRSFNTEEVSFTDEASMKVMKLKMANGTELEKIYVLDLIKNDLHEKQVQSLLLLALRDTSDIVKKSAILIIKEMKLTEMTAELLNVLKKEKNPVLIAAALDALFDLGQQPENASEFIQNNHPAIRHAAIVGEINKNGNEKNEAEEELHELILSPGVQNKLYAADILGELNDEKYNRYLISLMHEENASVADAAIDAAGKNANNELIEELMHLLPLKETHVLLALEKAGAVSIPYIKSFLLSDKCAEEICIRLIHLLGRIKGEASCFALIDLVENLRAYSKEVIKVLHKSNYKADEQHYSKVEALIHQYLSRAHENKLLQQQLMQYGKGYDLLIRSLKTELEELEVSLLYLFSFLYDKDRVDQILRSLFSKKKENIANAIELVEIIIPKQFGVPFIHLLETNESIDAADTFFKAKELPSVSVICKHILKNEEQYHNHWTQACCLYTAMNNQITIDPHIIQHYSHSTDPLLKELALTTVNVQ